MSPTNALFLTTNAKSSDSGRHLAIRPTGRGGTAAFGVFDKHPIPQVSRSAQRAEAVTVVGVTSNTDRPATYLDRIVEAHRAEAANDPRNLSELAAAAQFHPSPTRGFRRALQAPGLSVIAEIKRRSPSKGALNADLDPGSMAIAYETGGAACVSVLTDVDHFGGSISDLQAARNSCSLPAIRKDFTVCLADVYDSRLMGADCVLLIAACLSDDELGTFHQAAVRVGLDVLVEIHDETELARALAVGATLVGVNQRDLVTFAVDHERALRVGRSMPSDLVRVAESGVRGPDDAASLAGAGFDAVLVGESIVTSGDPAASVAALIAAGDR